MGRVQMSILPVRFSHIPSHDGKFGKELKYHFTNETRDSENNCQNQIGGFEGLPSPGSILAAPARSATCWRG